MKRFLFLHLAADGMRKNRRLYFPYLVSVISACAITYILSALGDAPALASMKGGTSLGIILNLGTIVLGCFSVVFLIYTNSFLIKRRYAEFGLYNVLGMGKGGILKIIFWETVISFILCMALGLLAGIGLYKIAELGLCRIVKIPASFDLFISPDSITFTLEFFAGIFLLLLGKSLLQVRLSKPLDLLKSTSTGERPPRVNWVFALLGAILLITAYFMAVSIQSPLDALNMFFFAVLLVIAGTYLLFMAGSVAICRILRANKKYYYKKQHFVSVSTMAYRMKRNGAGLASICILLTMVLVMVSSTSALFFGQEDILDKRYPRDNNLNISVWEGSKLTQETCLEIRKGIEARLQKDDIQAIRQQELFYVSIAGRMREGVLQTYEESDTPALMEDLCFLYIIPQDHYNQQMNTDIELKDGECIVVDPESVFKGSDVYTIVIEDGLPTVEFQVVGSAKGYPRVLDTLTFGLHFNILVVRDTDQEIMEGLYADRTTTGYTAFANYEFHFDTDKELTQAEKEEIEGSYVSICKTAIDKTMDHEPEHYTDFSLSHETREGNALDFYSTFGGLFFLAILLSLIFLMACIMIIYYKQISEGYEDQSRFTIMRKVGMTDEDIKKSINSQIMTVFYAPLAAAAVHLAFSFPMVWKMLRLFELTNLNLAILVNVLSFIFIGLLYALVYKVTGRSYFMIVTGREKRV